MSLGSRGAARRMRYTLGLPHTLGLRMTDTTQTAGEEGAGQPGPPGGFAYDIEVVGMDWEAVDEPTRRILERKERSPEGRAALPGRLALFPGLGRIISIGLAPLGGGPGILLQEGEVTRAEDTPDGRIEHGPEEALLGRFWEIVAGAPRLVTFNGRGYDGPMLTVRTAQLGGFCSRDLVHGEGAVDLMRVLDFDGARRPSYSLDYWCRRLGIESPKDGIDGSKVGEAYAAGRIDEIGRYCLRDAQATAELYRRLSRAGVVRR